MIKPFRNYFTLDSKLCTLSSQSSTIYAIDDYIYEVIEIIKGIPVFLEDHLKRLNFSLNAVNIQYDVNLLVNDIELVIKANQNTDGNIKIILWNTNLEIHSMVFYEKHYYPTNEEYEEGVVVGLMNEERINPNIKKYNSKMRDAADKCINDNNFNEVLLVNNDGFITEGSRSNVFFIKNNEAFTSPAYQVLEGITRQKVISIIKNNNIIFSECEVSSDNLSTFDAVFLTGTSKKVLPVKNIYPVEKQYNVKHEFINTISTAFLKISEAYINEKRYKV